MKQSILKRLAALEKRPAKPKAFDQLAIERRALAETGLPREQFMVKFGSFPNWAYLKMVTGDGSPGKPIPSQYKDVKEYYFAILHKHSS